MTGGSSHVGRLKPLPEYLTWSSSWAEPMTFTAAGILSYLSARNGALISKNTRGIHAEDTKAGMIQAYLDRYTGAWCVPSELFREA